MGRVTVVQRGAMGPETQHTVEGSGVDQSVGPGVSLVGAVNGDGLGDLVVGASGAECAGGDGPNGSAEIHFGLATGTPPVTQLAPRGNEVFGASVASLRARVR